jgi:hypothetical protein
VKREIPRHATVVSWAWGIVRQAVAAADFTVVMNMTYGERNATLRQGVIAERWPFVLQSLENCALDDFEKVKNELQIEAALVVVERRRLQSVADSSAVGTKGSADRQFLETAIEEARKSRTEAGHVPLKGRCRRCQGWQTGWGRISR